MQSIGLPCPKEVQNLYCPMQYKIQTHRGDDDQGTSIGKELILPGTDLCLPWEESFPLQSKVACKLILSGLQQVTSKLLSKPNECDHAKGCIPPSLGT